MASALTALIVFGIFPGLIFGFVLLSRYLKYRETKMLLEHGITPPQPSYPPPPTPMSQVMPSRPAPHRSRAQLTWGLVLSGVGLALTLGLWPIGLIANGAMGEGGPRFPLGIGPWMLGGFIPLFVGLALILGHVATLDGSPATGPTPPHDPRTGTPFPIGDTGEKAAQRDTPPVSPPLSLTEEMALRPDPLAPPRPTPPSPP